MIRLESIVKDCELVQRDELAGFTTYCARRHEVRRGEFDVMHIVFRPMINETIVDIRFTNASSTSGRPAGDRTVPLPRGYGDFLCETNGAYFFGGNVALFGLIDNYDVPLTHPVKYRSPEISTPNVLARSPRLREEDVHLGTYFGSHRMLIFDPIASRVILTEAFSRKLYRSWASFDEYLRDELTTYDCYFDSRRQMTRNRRTSPF